MTFMLSFGKYGGFYFTGSRLCLGWMALSVIPVDIDEILVEWKELAEAKEKAD